MLLIIIFFYFIIIPIAIGEMAFGLSVLAAVILYGLYLFSKRTSLRLDKHAQKVGTEKDKVVLTTSASLSAGLVVHNYVLENIIRFKELRLTLVNADGDIEFVDGIENVLAEIPRLLDYEDFSLIIYENDNSWPTFVGASSEDNELRLGYTRYNEAGERILPEAFREKIPVTDNPIWEALVQKLDLPLDTIVKIELENNSEERELVTKSTFGDLLEQLKNHTFTCPVCGYEEMDGAAYDEFECPTFDICECCGIEFGYEDSASSISEREQQWKELRQKWIDGGKLWWSDSKPSPEEWNADAQLKKFE